jgi:NAD(P)-dependent dehydrogenase (short-subunit alcohol dehydrogenase family)
MAAGSWSTDEARARLRRTVPLGRVAQGDDIASVASFLLSDSARYVTGQVFAVDGGATTT